MMPHERCQGLGRSYAPFRPDKVGQEVASVATKSSAVRALVSAVTGCALALTSIGAASASARSTTGCTVTWKAVGASTFLGPNALTRSQGVTSDGTGWIFSWQGGLERTTDGYVTQAAGTWPPALAAQPSVNSDGTNHVGDNHIGDIDYYDGHVYVPLEDGGENLGPAQLNNPEYQQPYVALYDAKTLQYTGVSYALDKNISEAGVPWVAVNAARREVYTAEWDMPHDRINVFDLQLHFERFLPLVYPASLGAGFHLSRIQGAKVFGHTLFATRDDADKTVFAIDLRTGVVSKLFSLNPGVPAELEGLAVRPTSDGALLHVLIVLDNQEDPTDPNSAKIRTVLYHYAPVKTC